MSGALKATKNRDGAKVESWLPFRLDRIILGKYPDGDDVSSLALEEVDPAVVASVESEMDRAVRTLRERIAEHCFSAGPGSWIELASIVAALGEEGFGEKSNRAAYFRRVVLGGKSTVATRGGSLAVRTKGRGVGLELTATKDAWAAADEEGSRDD